jgi:predicted porin
MERIFPLPAAGEDSPSRGSEMKRILVLAIVILGSCLMAHRVHSQETAVKEVAQEPAMEEAVPSEIYTFPVIRPEVSLFGGYRFAGFSGTPRADQYEYLHDSVPFGGEARIFSYPHRLHLDVDVANAKDYFGDLSYAYKDIIVLRGLDRTLWHNLANTPLIDLDPTTPSPGVNVRDGGVEYGMKVSIRNAFLRFKTPDFPFHLYIDGSLIDKTGQMQQRFLDGSGSFNNIVRVSEQRNVDWKTKSVLFGANSHLGPIEADFSHGERRLDVSGDKVFSDFYTDSAARPAGVFAHNLIPDISSSSNTLKLHTAYTGSIVATATFSSTKTENKDSGTRADSFIGSGDLVWMPMPKLTFFAKYRHKDIDMDNPATVTVADLSNPLQTFVYPVKAALSSSTDTVSGTVRYLPVKGVTLKAEYEFQNVSRENADLWNLPETTRSNSFSASADIRIVRNLNLKARYTYFDMTNPAYNNQPDHSNSGKISLLWIPVPQVNTYLSYSVAREKRNNLIFVEPDNTITNAHNRDVHQDMVMGSATVLILKDLSVTGSYAYMHNRTQQDIEYHDLDRSVQIDPAVPNKQTAQTVAVDVSYVPRDNITLRAGMSYTLSSGQFYPEDVKILEPVSIAVFSAMKQREMVYTLSGEYRFKNGFGLEVRYRYTDLKDVQNNPFDDVQNGNAHVFMVVLSKKW